MAPPSRDEEARSAAREGRGAPLSRCIDRGHADYPLLLEDLAKPPDPLWTRGNLAVLDRPCVAIVGTRRATPYATRVARELGRALAQAGACVVSGLALGVDAAAHRGALDAGGATCAVLGTGINRLYPKSNEMLAREILEQGLAMSELSPESTGHGGSFPSRNRIIAALSKVTIVVEAPEKSGALKTAEDALGLGRTLAAVPGPIDVPQSLGSNLLIRDGAAPITSMADALALVGLTPSRTLSSLPENGYERQVLHALQLGDADVDTLCARTGLPTNLAVAAVTQLELLGFVECALSGEVRRV